MKVGDTIYVVLYSPRNGANTVKFSAGTACWFWSESTTLTFNSALSGKTEVPILSRETLPAKSLDLSRPCDGYFSNKLQHLSDILTLTEAQQTEIKPIFEQETGEVSQLCFNPAISREEKLKRFKKIVRASDEKIKPTLTGTQVHKLQDLRAEQEQELKEIVARQKGQPN